MQLYQSRTFLLLELPNHACFFAVNCNLNTSAFIEQLRQVGERKRLIFSDG